MTSNICQAIYLLSKETRYVFVPFLSQEQIDTIESFHLKETLAPQKHAFPADEFDIYNYFIDQTASNTAASKYLTEIVITLKDEIASCKNVDYLGDECISANFPHLDYQWHWDTKKGNSIKAIIFLHGQPTLFAQYEHRLYSVESDKFFKNGLAPKDIA